MHSLASVAIVKGVTDISGFPHRKRDLVYHCHIKGTTEQQNAINKGTDVFTGSGVTEIICTDGVTTIGYSAFRGCTLLTSINIPDSVTTIGESAFYGCTALTTITYEGKMEQWNAISIGTDAFTYVSVTEIICADGTVTV